MDQVVLLDEDLAQPALAAGVVLEVELVEAVERVFVGVHVERVDVEVVARHRERVEDLFGDFCFFFVFFCGFCLVVFVWRFSECVFVPHSFTQAQQEQRS